VLGVDRRCPSESTIRRVLGKVDPDWFDAVLGGFVQRLCAQQAVAGRRRVLAVDGKTVRGSRHVDSTGAEVAMTWGPAPVQTRGLISSHSASSCPGQYR
jgi:hypothetical protein